MAAKVPMQLVEKQHWLEPMADQLQPIIANALAAGGGPIGSKVANALHGTWLGHPLHSVLTDVPIGAWTATAVLDAVDEISGRETFGRAAQTTITVGLVGAIGAALTGMADWSKMNHGHARRVGLAHGLLNTAGVTCYVTSLMLRRRRAHRAGRGFALLGLLISSAAAYLGGHLVYSEQIGVDHTADQSPPETFEPVLEEAELMENQLRRVHANGMPILLLRQGERIYALAETCAHLGGPLAEGRLDGASVVCPWHGSRYALEDGRVLDGPSAHAQPCLEVRVRNGHIEVRAADH
jgi:nitrite reductase/ring-hydroxylating ferredoxin subunit/uncharacterized membrane protein